jgi:hypothetical protein
MIATPHPGRRGVGGATPHHGAALTDEVAGTFPRPPCDLPTLSPVEAMLAALAWHANQAITRHVDLGYGLAELARAHGRAVADTAESTLPDGPLRDTVSAASRVYIDFADIAAQAATRYGRHFGHLAFAFPRP